MIEPGCHDMNKDVTFFEKLHREDYHLLRRFITIDILFSTTMIISSVIVLYIWPCRVVFQYRKVRQADQDFWQRDDCNNLGNHCRN